MGHELVANGGVRDPSAMVPAVGPSPSGPAAGPTIRPRARRAGFGCTPYPGSMTMLRDAADVQTAPLTALGLIGGFLTARETGLRWVGGIVLGGAGFWAGRTWLAKRGPAATVGLSALYLGAFGGSHPLAKKIGAWPAVLALTAVVATVTFIVADRDA